MIKLKSKIDRLFGYDGYIVRDHPIRSWRLMDVINSLKRVLPHASYEHSLDMRCGRISDKYHICGTCHCFAGWYLLGEKWDLESTRLPNTCLLYTSPSPRDS